MKVKKEAFVLIVLSLLWMFCGVRAQNMTNMTQQEQDALNQCRGIFLTYSITNPVEKIWPYTTVPSQQPYKFESEVTLTNTGFEDLIGWEVFIDFQYEEVIAEAPDILFADGSSPPVHAGNGTTVFGSSQPDLQNSIETAEDMTKIQTNFTLTGTEFGVGPLDNPPLPRNLSLLNQGWDCGELTTNSGKNGMWICCSENKTEINSTSSSDYLRRQDGDIVMYYDVIQAWNDHYVARVTITLDDPIGRVDHWNLTWDWRHGEFINSMSGAETKEQDQTNCVDGAAAKHYTGMDFSAVMSCEVSPTIIDLTQYGKGDLTGTIGAHCCRNGTLLPALVDPSQSTSMFTLQVYKVPPYLQIDSFDVPVNWRIASGFTCTNPRLVSPSETLDGSGLRATAAVRSWQVVCNKTLDTTPKCCVSFSAYYSDSVIPCPTCACGCSQSQSGQTCNPNIKAMLLPSNALLLPASNRTPLALQLANLHHYQIPDVLPCPDNCGVNINWHVYSDYKNGWSARMTLFNWDGIAVPDWFSAVELDKAMPGFQAVYTFNGSLVPGMNNTLLMQGHTGYDNNYLLGIDGLNPGKLQSLMSFDKRKTPGIQVTAGDGFPSHVWFDGQECALPASFPTSASWRLVPWTKQVIIGIVATVLVLGLDPLQLFD